MFQDQAPACCSPAPTHRQRGQAHAHSPGDGSHSASIPAAAWACAVAPAVRGVPRPGPPAPLQQRGRGPASWRLMSPSPRLPGRAPALRRQPAWSAAPLCGQHQLLLPHGPLAHLEGVVQPLRLQPPPRLRTQPRSRTGPAGFPFGCMPGAGAATQGRGAMPLNRHQQGRTSQQQQPQDTTSWPPSLQMRPPCAAARHPGGGPQPPGRLRRAAAAPAWQQGEPSEQAGRLDRSQLCLCCGETRSASVTRWPPPAGWQCVLPKNRSQASGAKASPPIAPQARRPAPQGPHVWTRRASRLAAWSGIGPRTARPGGAAARHRLRQRPASGSA